MTEKIQGKFGRVRDILKPYRDSIHQIPGVVGSGISHSSITGIGKGHHLVVFIQSEDPSIINQLPAEINGVPVAYQVTGMIKPATVICTNPCTSNCGFIYRYRPIEGGSSVSIAGLVNDQCTVGTIGGFPYSHTEGANVLLSNWHVIVHRPVLDIIQPSTVDGGDTDTDVIGTLRSWVDIMLPPGINKVDCAYALLNPNISIDQTNLCGHRINHSVDPIIGMNVVKAGRTTGCTHGTITAIDVSFSIDLSLTDTPVMVSFEGQIQTSQNMGSHGDSGSVLVTDDQNNNAVGLLFSGDQNGSAYCNVMKDVEAALGITFGDVGNVSFTSVPSGARIWIDGSDQGVNTPYEFAGLPVGTHTYTLRLSGYQDATGNFTVTQNATADVSVTLTTITSTGYAYFMSSPSGARIWVDNIDQGLNTPDTITLSTGNHTYKLTLAGYQDATGNFTIIADTTTEVLVTLTVGIEGVSFTSIPSGAEIWIDGIDRGFVTPNTIIDLVVGSHTYKLTLPGYQDATGSFTVIAGAITDINITLATINTGDATFTSIPSGAEIWIDNIDRGLVTPNTITGIIAGNHTYKLTLSGYQDAVGGFSINPGLTTPVPIVELIKANQLDPIGLVFDIMIIAILKEIYDGYKKGKQLARIKALGEKSTIGLAQKTLGEYP